MIKTIILKNKLFLWAVIAVVTLSTSSWDTPPSTYDWKMNVKYGPAWPETSAHVLANNPAGILARSAHFNNYDRIGISIRNSLVYWTVDDLEEAVNKECLYVSYGDQTGPYEASLFMYSINREIQAMFVMLQQLPNYAWVETFELLDPLV